jgi:hypothetical protein
MKKVESEKFLPTDFQNLKNDFFALRYFAIFKQTIINTDA